MIKVIFTDIDGVWTDGGMYYTEGGDEFKKFNVMDGVGVLLAREAGKEIVIITGENSKCVSNRANKLKINKCYLGVRNKLDLAIKIAKELNVSLSECAFIGDEINDHILLKKVGFSACPSSAPSYTKEIVDQVVESKGGYGAFKNFVIAILEKEGTYEHAFKQITSQL